MKNKSKVIEILNNDCNIRCTYYYKGQTCAVGALALVAGVGIDTLEEAGSDSIRSSSKPSVATICDAIQKEFGIGRADLACIQIRNDSNPEHEERRRSVVEYVERVLLKGSHPCLEDVAGFIKNPKEN